MFLRGGDVGVLGVEVYVSTQVPVVCKNEAWQSGSTYPGTTTGWHGGAGARRLGQQADIKCLEGLRVHPPMAVASWAGVVQGKQVGEGS